MFPQPHSDRYISDHQAELLREAEQHRISQTDELAQIGQRVATAVGDLLINAGTHLKSRYADAEEQLHGLYPAQEPLSTKYAKSR
jgi:hypothetical protein